MRRPSRVETMPEVNRPRGKPEDEDDVIPLDTSKIKCEHRLGGILKHYYRDAA